MSENVIDLTQASSPLGDIPPEKDSNLMLLKSTILATPLHRLRGVLAEVCERLPEAAVLVKNALIVQREPPKIIREEPARINTPMTRIPRSSEDGSDESDQESETEELEEESEIEDTESEDSSFEDPWSAAVAINGKKMRSRYAICKHCNEEFDVTQNEKGDCEWHAGQSTRMVP